MKKPANTCDNVLEKYEGEKEKEKEKEKKGAQSADEGRPSVDHLLMFF